MDALGAVGDFADHIAAGGGAVRRFPELVGFLGAVLMIVQDRDGLHHDVPDCLFVLEIAQLHGPVAVFILGSPQSASIDGMLQ